jgi:hypothetical protein
LVVRCVCHLERNDSGKRDHQVPEVNHSKITLRLTCAKIVSAARAGGIER